MTKYFKVYINKKDGYGIMETEVARFTSKGMMMLCLPVIQETYKNTEYCVTWDHEAPLSYARRS